jgi:hypothetical protein
MKLAVVGVWLGLATFALVGAGPLAAQQSGSAKIAYVNTPAMLTQTPG